MKKTLKFIKKNFLWLIAFAGLTIFTFIVRRLFTNNISYIDSFVYDQIKWLICPPLTQVFKIITEFGNFYIMTFILIIILITGKDKSFKKYFTINYGLVALLNVFLKSIFERQRPVDINLIVENGFSFPSGHSMVSFAFYGFLAYYIYHSNLKKPTKYFLIILQGIIVCLIGLSRIYLGAHYFTDVIGGFSITAVYLVLYIKFVYQNQLAKEKEVK